MRVARQVIRHERFQSMQKSTETMRVPPEGLAVLPAVSRRQDTLTGFGIFPQRADAIKLVQR